MKEVLLILLGFILGQLPDWIKRKRILKAHWNAIWAEVNIDRVLALKYMDDKVAAPLYRLPTDVYDNSFPALLSEGNLEPKEVAEISIFFNLVKEINRGLDNVAEMHKTNDTEKLEAEYSRNLEKANMLVDISREKIDPIIRKYPQPFKDNIEKQFRRFLNRKHL